MDSGVHIPPWSGRRAQEALARVKAEGRRRKSPCCICHQPIDYSLPSTDAWGCTVQHLKSRKRFPHLTWDPRNWGPAHRDCNTSAGASDGLDNLGVVSTDW